MSGRWQRPARPSSYTCMLHLKLTSAPRNRTSSSGFHTRCAPITLIPSRASGSVRIDLPLRQIRRHDLPVLRPKTTPKGSTGFTLERVGGIEPLVVCLEGRHSTIELYPHCGALSPVSFPWKPTEASWGGHNTKPSVPRSYVNPVSGAPDRA